MSAVLLSADMMVSSRVMAAARQLGVPLAIAVSPADLKVRLSSGTRLVMVDLSQSGMNIGNVVGAVRADSLNARIIAFGPHVDERLLASASDAGCDEVMSNGEFHRSSTELLRRHATVA